MTITLHITFLDLVMALGFCLLLVLFTWWVRSGLVKGWFGAEFFSVPPLKDVGILVGSIFALILLLGVAIGMPLVIGFFAIPDTMARGAHQRTLERMTEPVPMELEEWEEAMKR